MSTSGAQSEEDLTYHTIDKKKANELKDGQINEDELSDLERKIKGLGNVTRLRILSFLCQEDLCVHDLTALLNMSQSAVSHQLKELRNLGILNRKKDGRVVYYSMNDKALNETLSQLKEHLTE